MAGHYVLKIDQGATKKLLITCYTTNDHDPGDPVLNLTGYSARSQIRRAPGASNPPYASLTSSSGIVLGGAAGTIAMTWTDEITGAIPAGKWSWDLEIESGGGEVTRLLDGAVIVSPEVTV